MNECLKGPSNLGNGTTDAPDKVVQKLPSALSFTNFDVFAVKIISMLFSKLPNIQQNHYFRYVLHKIIFLLHDHQTHKAILNE